MSRSFSPHAGGIPPPGTGGHGRPVPTGAARPHGPGLPAGAPAGPGSEAGKQATGHAGPCTTAGAATDAACGRRRSAPAEAPRTGDPPHGPLPRGAVPAGPAPSAPPLSAVRPAAPRRTGCRSPAGPTLAPPAPGPAPARRAGGRHPLRGLALSLGLSLGLGLAACTSVPPAQSPGESLRPVPRREAPEGRAVPSVESRLMAQLHADRQARALARGDMRRDGGAGTPYDAADLARIFERIAFQGEHAGSAASGAGGASGMLLRWQGPVRARVHFGASVPASQQEEDRARILSFLARLERVTRHPIGPAAGTGNFHVLVMGEDDRPQMLRLVRRLVPDISSGTLNVLRSLPDEIPCLVMGFAGYGDRAVYDRAVAVIRAELPELTRRACIHEELSQGLGLRNDSPEARPSIFNDDEEFALLTSLDEKMLRMLYDPRLTPGMTPEEARPIIARIAAELMGAGPISAADLVPDWWEAGGERPI